MQERNELARDAFSYLHLPMVAAIVLVAFGLKSTLAHVGDPLAWEAATALLGGSALYLLSHVAFKLRSLRTFSAQRLVTAGVLACLIVYEVRHFANARREIRAAERERDGEH